MKTSFISNNIIKNGEAIKGADIREGVFDLIKLQNPNFSLESYISNDELNQFRRLYLASLIIKENEELAIIDRDVMDAIKNISILSCLAAIQAPIIMMSQNRQEQKDRPRGEHDYKINLKAELEIKLLSEKMDHLLVHQNKKLLEIQQVQTGYLEDLMKELKINKS